MEQGKLALGNLLAFLWNLSPKADDHRANAAWISARPMPAHFLAKPQVRSFLLWLDGYETVQTLLRFTKLEST